MSNVFLLAGSFMRQNRWLALGLVAWPFVMGALLWSPHRQAQGTDITEIIQQEVFYGLAVIAFLASSAIYNEKRSRRMIGVLSKAVSRGEYLLGFLFGSVGFGFLYFVAIAVSILWLRTSSESTQPLLLVLYGTIACLWISSLALLFAAFLHPVLAAAAVGACAVLPSVLAQGRYAGIVPFAALLSQADPLSVHLGGFTLILACLESAVFMAVAAWIFGFRDLATSIE